jgi:hypothetical protein
MVMVELPCERRNGGRRGVEVVAGRGERCRCRCRLRYVQVCELAWWKSRRDSEGLLLVFIVELSHAEATMQKRARF